MMHALEKFRLREREIPVYFALTVSTLLLVFVGQYGEPFSLPLYYAALTTGANLFLTAGIYLLAGALTLSFPTFLVYLIQSAFFTLSFFLFRKLRVRSPFLFPLLLAANLLPYLFLFPEVNYPALSFLPALWQKSVFCLLFFGLGLLFTPALRLLGEKVLRCRLTREELLLLSVLFCLTNCGLYRLHPLVYIAFNLFFLLLYASLMHGPSLTVFALLCAVPPAVFNFSPVPLAVGAVCACLILFFLPLGKLPAVLAVLFLHAVLCFFDGLYEQGVPRIVFSLLCVLVPCLVYLFLPARLLKKGERAAALYRDSHLSRLAVNRNRSAVGEQLFTLSGVFRGIAAAITDPPNADKESEARRLLREAVAEEVCAECPQRKRCRASGAIEHLDKLIAVGCAKGRVNLIDLPVALTAACPNTGGLLFCLNKQLSDYRRYAAEAESAREGRRLLALQAQGVSELLRHIALEQSKPLDVYDEREKELAAALARKGVVLHELFIYGEGENIRLSLTVFGKCENEKIVKAASEVLGFPLITGEKLILSADKFCYTLRKKPKYDAVFGIAAQTKAGMAVSGDTHSVLRIDEKRFLVALSDGMGSGAEANRISRTAISLLESFYRSGMPSDVILPSVNKLLSFSREESFVCLDLACVDLESGRADVVKIGAPLGFIFTAGSIRVLEGESLPLGMLDDLHPSTLSLKLNDGDMLVFVSDGICDAFGSSSDLFDYLKRLSPLNPQTFADGMLKTALAKTQNVARDDMTVVAVRIFAAR